MTGVTYPVEGSWTWGGNDVFGLFNLGDLGFSDFAGSGIVHLAGTAAALRLERILRRFPSLL
jgi:Amt family ammonium transporter